MEYLLPRDLKISNIAISWHSMTERDDLPLIGSSLMGGSSSSVRSTTWQSGDSSVMDTHFSLVDLRLLFFLMSDIWLLSFGDLYLRPCLDFVQIVY